MTFGELIEGLGKNLGVELTDEGGAAAVEVDGIPVVLQRASDDLLLVHADLGEVAPENRERVLAAAMEANFLYQGTGGATLAVDSRDGHLHLQKYNWLDRIDMDKVLSGLTRFADTVKAWKEIAAASTAYTPSSASQTFGGFMKV